MVARIEGRRKRRREKKEKREEEEGNEEETKLQDGIVRPGTISLNIRIGDARLGLAMDRWSSMGYMDNKMYCLSEVVLTLACLLLSFFSFQFIYFPSESFVMSLDNSDNLDIPDVDPLDPALEATTLPKFDMHLYKSSLNETHVKWLIKCYKILEELHPRVVSEGITMDELPNDAIRLYVHHFQQGGLRVPFSIIFLKVGNWFSFQSRVGKGCKPCFKDAPTSLKKWKDNFSWLTGGLRQSPCLGGITILAWRIPPKSGEFNESDVERLREVVITLHKPSPSLLYAAGLFHSWKHARHVFILKDPKGNAVGTLLPPGTAQVTHLTPPANRLEDIPLRTGDMVVAEMPYPPCHENVDEHMANGGAGNEHGDENIVDDWWAIRAAHATEPRYPIRTNKYEELSVVEKLQADCDLKATNIVFQGLPPDVYAIVNLMQDTKLSLQEKECKLYDEFDKFSFVKGLMKTLYHYYRRDLYSLIAIYERHQHVNAIVQVGIRGLAVSVFTQGDDPIACLNKAMAFLTVATIQDSRVTVNKFKGGKDKVMLVLAIRVMLLVSGEIMQEGRQGLLNVIIVKVKDTWLGNALSLIGQGTLHGLRKRQCWLKHRNPTEDLDAYDSDCDHVSNAKAVPIANLSNYGSDIISEVPHVKPYHSDMDNQSVHAMQGFEQTPVVDFTENEITRKESLTAELERYKERVKTFEQRLNIDLSTREKMIDSQMYDMIKEKLALKQKIDLENHVIVDEETLILEEVSRSKMFAKQNDPMSKEKKVNTTPINYVELNRLSKDFCKCFIPQQELSDEQAFWLQTSHPNTDQSASSQVPIIEAPKEFLRVGNVTISRVYYVEGLGHNLFSVEQFCDANLEVAFQKNTCFIWNSEGIDLLSGSRNTNLYTISPDDMLKTSLICLLSKALRTKSWLWHRQLSDLNFGTPNKLAKDGLARGISKLKFKKDHLCSACALGPMRMESINGKKYILVIVDDYSRFTWVKFLRSNDEAPDTIIKCI
ncbi:retrovirus-related pol polyprotein from transposon TNT 1-94 [Tanacetum coccineum]